MLNKGSIFSGTREPGVPVGGGGKVISSNVPSSLSSGAGNPPAASRVQEPAPVAEPPGAKLVVGPGVKLKGAEIQDCDTLLVEGRVEATMDSKLIQIADQGSFDGKVNIDVAEVRGRFSGELTARDHLIIHSTGRVSGKIRYGKIVVHDGGEVSGDIQSLNADSAHVVKPDMAANATAANAEESSITSTVNRLIAKTA
ncbi:MAG: polymer-forming cytoskeletal protein [Gammaproteobacteria bacterium]|nr:polymer-forming cytoskeletal protein [Gammaproteobacteria bacterium]MBU1416144.1 polymer-forming cytoskeletal protein [Gammaproteobacteria bacterium]